MTVEITISNFQSHLIDRAFLKDAIRLTLEKHNKSDIDITLQLTDNETIRQLNQAYRGINKLTDVLAFNQEFLNPETGRLYLGDVIISIEQAQKQAQENNVTLNKECALLTIHGTLHLLGYDHSEEQEKQQMWSMQDTIMRDLLLSREEELE